MVFKILKGKLRGNLVNKTLSRGNPLKLRGKLITMTTTIITLTTTTTITTIAILPSSQHHHSNHHNYHHLTTLNSKSNSISRTELLIFHVLIATACEFIILTTKLLSRNRLFTPEMLYRLQPPELPLSCCHWFKRT